MTLIWGSRAHQKLHGLSHRFGVTSWEWSLKTIINMKIVFHKLKYQYTMTLWINNIQVQVVCMHKIQIHYHHTYKGYMVNRANIGRKSAHYKINHNYLAPVLPSGYCCCLRLFVLPSIWLSLCQSQNCPRNNFSPVQARITKFDPEV